VYFPKDFFWGAATSAYQVEGDNKASDWWRWEKRTGLKETSGCACRQYELFREDFDLAKRLNHNAHRLSIEWSRLEPQEGKFPPDEIRHYIDVIQALKERGIEPIVTLHHFTNPAWFADLGGWENKNAGGYFLRYVKRVVEALCGNVRFWVTINEPMVYAYRSYLEGSWPPQKKSFLKAREVALALASSHIKAYSLIHSIYRKRDLPVPSVSIAKNIRAFVPCTGSLKNRLAVYLRNRIYNFGFIDKLVRAKALDFIGVNYYTRELADAGEWSPRELLLGVCRKGHHPLKKNSMGWDIYPRGLFEVLVKLKKYGLPVFILENGICTARDDERWDFICGHLRSVHRAIGEGVKMIGYLYWSLIDNYEWDSGFGPRFGIVGVNYNTCRRAPRESAGKFAAVCKTGRL